MKFESSNVFYGIVSFVFVVIIIFLLVNIYYIRQPTNATLWITSDFLTLVNVMIIIVIIILLALSLFMIFGNRNILRKISFFNEFETEGYDGNIITVKRIEGDLFSNIHNPDEFYKCQNRKCDKTRPSDKFIRENKPDWENTVIINN